MPDPITMLLLVAAGVLTLAQAAPLVRLRAAAMQEAVPVGTGAMAAILGMEASRVIAGCAEAAASFGPGSTEVVEAVNFNDPIQTVIAGTKAGVDKACELLKAAGAKRALPLPVSAPFHSSLMKPAAEKLRMALSDVVLAVPQIPVLNNVDVAVQQDADAIRDALYRQAFGPVRWVECVQALQARGVTHLIECGPGKVLAGLTKRIDAGLVSLDLRLAHHRDGGRQVEGALLDAAAGDHHRVQRQRIVGPARAGIGDGQQQGEAGRTKQGGRLLAVHDVSWRRCPPHGPA